MSTSKEAGMKYIYQYHDGEEWVSVKEQLFNSPQEAKQAGVQAGFEHVRIMKVSMNNKEVNPQ